MSASRREPGGHGVGVRGVSQPEVVGEQRVELSREEAHLGRELHVLLAEVLRVDSIRLVHDDDGLDAHRAVLGAAEAEHVRAGCECGDGAAEGRGGVG